MNNSVMQVRAGNGFQYIRAVMLRSDFETVNVLYDFTEEALKTSGTGRLEDLENWYSGNYDERFRHLLTNPRPWCHLHLWLASLQASVHWQPAGQAFCAGAPAQAK